MNDKLLHFLMGAGSCLIFGLLVSPIFGLAVGIAAGIGKEVWDSMGHGTPDILDAFATVAGTFLIYFLLLL